MKKKTPLLKNLNKHLSSRLTIVGSLLIVFSLSALTYGILAPSDSTHSSPPEEFLSSGVETPDLDGTLSQEERMRIFAVSGIFAIVATLCLYKARKTRA